MEKDQEWRSQHRIAHVTVVHNSRDPRIFYKQLRSLSDAGFETHLIAPQGRSERRNGVKIHALPKPENRLHRFLIQPRAYRTAVKLNAEIYQIHDPELLPLGYLLKLATGACVVYDMHEDYRSKGPVLGRGLRLLERWAFDWLDHVLLAEDSYSSVVADRGVLFTHIANYFRPPDEESYTDADKDRDPPRRLLYVGSVEEKRGLFALIELADRIKQYDRPEKLDLVGICRHRRQRASADSAIQERGLESVLKRVGWNRYVPNSEMVPYLRNADVGLALFKPHPNYVKSHPTKFFEYMHYGLPIICSDFPLWRDFVHRHRCGVTVPPNDPEEVVRVLNEWQSNPDLYRTLSENARRAASEYVWEKMAPRLISLYDGLVRGDGIADEASEGQ